MAVEEQTKPKKSKWRKTREVERLLEKIEQPHILTGEERKQTKKLRKVRKVRRDKRLDKQKVFIAGPEEIYEVGMDAFGRKLFEAQQHYNPVLFKVRCHICGDIASICQTRVLKPHELYIVCPMCDSHSFINKQSLVPYLRRYYFTIVPHSWDMEKIDKLVFFYELDYSKGVDECSKDNPSKT